MGNPTNPKMATLPENKKKLSYAVKIIIKWTKEDYPAWNSKIELSKLVAKQRPPESLSDSGKSILVGSEHLISEFREHEAFGARPAVIIKRPSNTTNVRTAIDTARLRAVSEENGSRLSDNGLPRLGGVRIAGTLCCGDVQPCSSAASYSVHHAKEERFRAE